MKKFYFVQFGVKLFKFTCDNNEAKECIYNSVPSEVKILSHLKLNRYLHKCASRHKNSSFSIYTTNTDFSNRCLKTIIYMPKYTGFYVYYLYIIFIWLNYIHLQVGCRLTLIQDMLSHICNICSEIHWKFWINVLCTKKTHELHEASSKFCH